MCSTPLQMVAPAVSVFSLSDLVEAAARRQRQARALANRAGRACLVARQFEDQTRTGRERRKEWAAILAHIPLFPDHPVVLCVSCRRVQAVHGWTILSAGIEDRLMTSGRGPVRYEFCPDCRRHQLLTGWPATKASAAC